MSVNDGIADELIWILRRFGFDLSEGSPDRVAQQAHQLRTAAAYIRSSYRQMSSDVQRLSASWTGDDATAQQQAWARHAELAVQVAEVVEGTAETLDHHVENSTRIVRAIIGVALELLETYLVCVALSWVSGHLADLVFASRIGLFIARLRALFSRLSAVVRRTTDSLKRYGTLAGKIGDYTRILLVEYVPDGIKEFPINLAATAVPAKLGGRDLDTDDVMLAMIPGIVQYGALNLVMEILEKENRLVRKLKSSIEGVKAGEVPELPELRLPRSLADSIKDDVTVSPEIRSLFSHAPAKDTPSLPGEYRLKNPDTGPSFAESLARDPELPAEVRAALAREFAIDLKARPDALTPDGTTFTRRTDRELVYTFLKETLVNGTSNILTGLQNGNTDWLSNAAISAPLSGMRKVALELWFKPMAYHGKPAGAPLDERMMSELIVRTLAYSLRNSVREAAQDAVNGEPVVTQLTPHQT